MATTTTTGTVGIYCRISKAPNGRTEGVDAQERWGREYAAKAWPGQPVRVYVDNNLSAANGGPRPDFDRLMHDVARGDLAHLWTVEQSRLERREAEWFAVAAELDAAGIVEVHTQRDGIVRVRDEIAGIKAVLAAAEVRKLKIRVNDRLGENAKNGLPSGATPFGYEHAVAEDGTKTLRVIPEQRDAMLWAAERVLAGWSLASVATGLRERGLKGRHGGEINGSTVKQMLTNPIVAGQRVHQGRIVGQGNWPAILDQETWTALRARLSQPRRVQRSDGGSYPIGAAHTGNPTGRRYLLTSGLAVCGVCGAPLVGSVKRLKNGKAKPYLLCHPNRGGKGCIGIVLEPTEDLVVDAIFDKLDRPDFLDQLAADEHAERRDQITRSLEGIDGQRTDLSALWGSGDLTTSEWQAAKQALTDRERTLRGELAEIPPPTIDVDLAGAREAWPLMTLDERREFCRLFIEKVTVNRATLGFQGFDQRRVTITWRRA